MLLVLFTLGDQRYGIDAAAVELIVPALPLRAVPGTPPSVAGVFPFRGQVVPVIDVSQLTLGRPAKPALSSRFIVARGTVTPDGEAAPRLIALLAEQVNEVREVPDAQLRPPPVLSPGAPFLGPVAETPAGLVQVITVENLLPPAVRELLFANTATAAADAAP